MKAQILLADRAILKLERLCMHKRTGFLTNQIAGLLVNMHSIKTGRRRVLTGKFLAASRECKKKKNLEKTNKSLNEQKRQHYFFDEDGQVRAHQTDCTKEMIRKEDNLAKANKETNKK